jgi:hypothetical protein
MASAQGAEGSKFMSRIENFGETKNGEEAVLPAWG